MKNTETVIMIQENRYCKINSSVCGLNTRDVVYCNVTVTYLSVQNNENHAIWILQLNVRYCCCLVDGKYVQCSVHWSCLTGLYLHSQLSRHCYTPVMYSPARVYTLCNIIVIIQFILQALGLNEPVLHLLRGRGEQALHNDRVPDGSQSVSTHGWLCHLYPLLSLRTDSWLNMCHVYMAEKKKTSISNMTASTTLLITRDKSHSLMCNLWTSHAPYCCYVSLGKMRWGRTSPNCILNTAVSHSLLLCNIHSLSKVNETDGFS